MVREGDSIVERHRLPRSVWRVCPDYNAGASRQALGRSKHVKPVACRGILDQLPVDDRIGMSLAQVLIDCDTPNLDLVNLAPSPLTL